MQFIKEKDVKGVLQTILKSRDSVLFPSELPSNESLALHRSMITVWTSELYCQTTLGNAAFKASALIWSDFSVMGGITACIGPKQSPINHTLVLFA